MEYAAKGASLSPDGRYRYRLWREWRNWPDPAHWRWMEGEDGKPAVDGAGEPLGSPETCVFIMLNPSTADAELDDPTIRRCVGFARSWGYDRLDVLNLFAYRTKSPAELLALLDADDPIGPGNSEEFSDLLDNDDVLGCPIGKIICAWGANGAHFGQDETVLGWLRDRPRYALRETSEGHPSHPLYLPKTVAPVPFRMAR